MGKQCTFPWPGTTFRVGVIYMMSIVQYNKRGLIVLGIAHTATVTAGRKEESSVAFAATNWFYCKFVINGDLVQKLMSGGTTYTVINNKN